jgi:hypothetical protein
MPETPPKGRPIFGVGWGGGQKQGRFFAHIFTSHVKQRSLIATIISLRNGIAAQ